MERLKGEWGWLGIAIFVAAFDYTAGETMSSAFRRGIENPVSRPLVLGGLALTAAHLCAVIPEPYDPFKQLLRPRHGSESEHA